MSYGEIEVLAELYYEEGAFDTVYHLDKELVDELRAEFKSNCYGVAETLRELYMQNSYIATIVTFKSQGGLLCPIKVYNELNAGIEEYTHHSIILFGDCCMDILHSDRVIRIKEYIEKLEALNQDGIRLDTLLSQAINKDGYYYVPTIEDIKYYVV